METPEIAYLVIGTLFGTVVSMASYVWGTRKGRKEGFEMGLREGRSQGKESGITTAHAEYTIEVIPVIDIQKLKTYVRKKNQIKVGYFYQLFIRGLPSLRSERIFIREESLAELHEDQIVKLAAEVVQQMALPTAAMIGKTIKDLVNPQKAVVQGKIPSHLKHRAQDTTN
jgi:hypothetical protein